jgi:hypothetical protein
MIAVLVVLGDTLCCLLVPKERAWHGISRPDPDRAGWPGSTAAATAISGRER